MLSVLPLFSLCIVEKGANNSRYSLFLFTGIRTDMLLIIFLALIAKLTSVSGDCDVGNLTQNNFDWDEVGINVLTWLLKEEASKTVVWFHVSFVVLLRY